MIKKRDCAVCKKLITIDTSKKEEDRNGIYFASPPHSAWFCKECWAEILKYYETKNGKKKGKKK